MNLISKLIVFISILILFSCEEKENIVDNDDSDTPEYELLYKEKYINTISRGVDYGESINSNFNNCTGLVYGYSYWIEPKYELAFNYRIIEDELITNNLSHSHLFSHNQFINYYTDELNNEDSQYNFDDYDDYETFIKSTQDKKVWYSEYNEEEDIYNNYDYDYEYDPYEDYNRIDYNTDTDSDSEYNSDLTDTEDMTDYDST